VTQYCLHDRSGFERLVQDSQLEADELRKKAQQAVRHKLATETDATKDKVRSLLHAITWRHKACKACSRQLVYSSNDSVSHSPPVDPTFFEQLNLLL